MPKLSICNLSGNALNHAEDLQILADAGIEHLHFDIMDGRAWPKISVGSGFVAGMKTSLKKDVHLLIEEPEKHIPTFAAAGADLIAFCVEHTEQTETCLDLIGQHPHIKRGVSLYPDTPLATIQPLLGKIDYIILLSISPTTGKDNYLSDIPAKIATLREWKSDLIISIDGAIKKDNVAEVATYGSDLIATGSAVFDGKAPAQNLNEMLESIKNS